MGVLAVYDTVGIQSYIFASNKLAENVGASKLVAGVFDRGGMLEEAIKEHTKIEDLPDWTKPGVLSSKLPVEIIYQGGGNAYVKFKNENLRDIDGKLISDEHLFNDVTKTFLINIAKNAPGIGVAVAAIETDFEGSYKEDFDNINNRLLITKGGFNMPVFAGNQPITKQSGRTGQPADTVDDGEFLNVTQMKKREKYKKLKNDKDIESKQFDDLAFEKHEDSLIAIIHADGNNMGKDIKEYMQSSESYSEAVPRMRELSSKIAKCYKKALDTTAMAFEKAYVSYLENLDKKPKDGKIKLPMLRLIDDGDDITVLVGGRFAIDFAVRLLREIEKTPPKERPFGEKSNPPTACAGVVLFHSHYPFSEAYGLAEGLCKFAKGPSRLTGKSYIDFHLHGQGNVAGLGQLRAKQYVVDGKSIICRPWMVSRDTDCMTSENHTIKTEETSYPTGTPNICWFEKEMPYISGLPKNKTKAIRNAIGTGDVVAELAVNRLIDVYLPTNPTMKKRNPEDKANPNKTPRSKYAAIFDLLEFQDAYVNLLNKPEVQDGV